MTRTHPNTTAVPVTDDGDAALVREYLYDVHYRWQAIHAQGQGGLDDPARPPLFTRPAEPRRRFRLPAGPRHRIGPLGAALREEQTPPVAGADRSGTGHGSDLERLGELLFYGYGFSRMDIGHGEPPFPLGHQGDGARLGALGAPGSRRGCRTSRSAGLACCFSGGGIAPATGRFGLARWRGCPPSASRR